MAYSICAGVINGRVGGAFPQRIIAIMMCSIMGIEVLNPRFFHPTEAMDGLLCARFPNDQKTTVKLASIKENNGSVFISYK